MNTTIYTSGKLEKLVRRMITKEEIPSSALVGNWNATVFFVDRKKCWLLTNKWTKYKVVLVDVRAADLSNIGNIFSDRLSKQLAYDGIITDYEGVKTMVGELAFCSTDNDRSTISYQNQRLHELDFWKYEFGTLENMPMIELTHRMNTSPMHVGKGRKMSDYTDPIREMKKMIGK